MSSPSSDVSHQILAALAATPDRDPFAWASRHLHLRDGKWRPERAALMRHWFDVYAARITGRPLPHDPHAHLCSQLYLTVFAQYSKTTTAAALAGWTASHHPRDIGWYTERDISIARIRRRSLVPMIEKTGPLNNLLPQTEKARDHALGPRLLEIGGTHLNLLNANLADDLRSIPLPLLFLDEMDKYALDVQGEGDPIDLALVRQRTMPHDGLLVGLTTPGAITGHGWSRLCSGSHERPLVRCDCGAVHFLDDRLIKSATEHTLDHYPAAVIRRERLARWVCPWCGVLHDAAAVARMVDECTAASRWIAGTWSQTDDHPSGIWTPAAEIDKNGRLLDYPPPTNTIRSGWLNALYSPHVTLDKFAADWVDKYHKGKPGQKKTWTNTEACRPYVHVTTATTTDDIVDRAAAPYMAGSCPAPHIDYLFLTWDQQGNQRGKYWWPGVLRAWIIGGESWLIWAGRANSPNARDQMEDMLFSIAGNSRAADLVAMDCANPNARQDVYDWAGEQPSHRWAMRGDFRLKEGENWREVPAANPNHPRRTNRPIDVREYKIHPHYWRDVLEEHLQANPARPPWHIPHDAPKFYLRSLNSEEQVTETRRVPGVGYMDVQVWRPRVTTATDETVNYRKDNHWADCEKMQLALADIAGIYDPTAVAERAAHGPAGLPPAAPDHQPEATSESLDSYDLDGIW